MQNRWRRVIALMAGAAVLSGCGLAGQAASKSARRPTGPAPEVIGFWAAGTDQSLSPLNRYPGSVTVFSPYFYSIEPTGALVSRVDPTVLQEARSLKLAVVPLFNTPGSQSFLGSIVRRLLLARTIAGLVRQDDYQGVDLDFEPAEPQYAAGLAAFVIDLRDFLPKGARLYLDLVPATPMTYRFAALTPEVTAYVLMTYDEHDDGSVAGPVAATPWVVAKIRRLLAMVPPDKVDMGLAFYGYDWLNGSTTAVTIPLSAVPSQALSRARYVPGDQEMTASYQDATGTTHRLWWETPQGLSAKLTLARTLRLRGVAVWRLGYQTAALLTLLQRYRNGAPLPRPSS